MTEDERDPVGDLREEAERLVSAGWAAVSYAMRAVGGDRPVRGVAGRVFDAVGYPSPRVVLKVAGGLTDVASGVAAVLRTIDRPRTAPPPPRRRDAGATWRAATRAAGEGAAARTGRAPTPGDDPWRAATADPPSTPGQRAETLLPPEPRD